MDCTSVKIISQHIPNQTSIHLTMVKVSKKSIHLTIQPQVGWFCIAFCYPQSPRLHEKKSTTFGCSHWMQQAVVWLHAKQIVCQPLQVVRLSMRTIISATKVSNIRLNHYDKPTHDHINKHTDNHFKAPCRSGLNLFSHGSGQHLLAS